MMNDPIMEDPILPKTGVMQDLKIYLRRRGTQRRTWVLIGTLVLATWLYIFMHKPPENFPIGQVVTIEPGESLQSISKMLYETNAIKSTFIFRTTVILLGGEKKMKAGDYLLDRKESPIELAYRFVDGSYHLAITKITIPEGWNIYQMADYLKKSIVNFERAEFVSLAKEKEGYLFPDTYFISPAIKIPRLLMLMEKNFEIKKDSIPAFATTTRSVKDIVTMASILEGEARTTESRKIIAGILWKRLSLNMPLQVDSTFSYINGKNTYELTNEDLQIDSPYNTYKYRGLPPGPIGNPGVDALEAALNPISTKYLYFLSSKSGTMYYATTFEQHKRNKELYLNK